MSLRTGILLISVICSLVLAVLLREVLLIGFLSIMIAVVFSFPIGLFSRIMPRGFAVVLTLILSGALASGIGAIAYRPISVQVSQLIDHIPDAVRRVQSWFEHTQESSTVANLTTKGQDLAETFKYRAQSMFEAALAKAGPAAISLSSVLSAFAIVVVLAAFLVHEPWVYKKEVETLLPGEHEPIFSELWNRMGVGLRQWMGGILIAMSIMGTFTALGLLAIGVHDWLLLGFLTFLGTFIPYVGAIISAVPGLILALSQSNHTFLGALIVYTLVHIVEGYIVEPMIMRRAVVIHPATLLIWQLIMATLFGILGIMVATPLLACIQIGVGYLWVERKLGKVQAK